VTALKREVMARYNIDDARVYVAGTNKYCRVLYLPGVASGHWSNRANHIQVVEPVRVSPTADGAVAAVLLRDVFFVAAFFAGAF
jgi:hypothetical protein